LHGDTNHSQAIGPSSNKISGRKNLAIFVVSFLFGFLVPKNRDQAAVYKRRFYMQSPLQKKAQTGTEETENEGEEYV